MELTDLLVTYPPSTKPGFQQLFSGKEEFRELASSTRERLTPGKKFFNHQSQYHRYLRTAKEIIILDAPGTGKTCSYTGFTEHCYRQRQMVEAGLPPEDEVNAHFRRAIILCNGPAQEAEIRKQLIYDCSQGRYLSTETVGGVTVNKVLNGDLDRFTEITTYTKFARRIQSEFPDASMDQLLTSRYSDTIFCCDEPHQITILPTGKQDRRKTRTYWTLWRVFHLVKRCKKIFSTATPMINETAELISLLNLLLPVNGVLPEDLQITDVSSNDVRVLFPGLPLNHAQLTREQLGKYYRGQIPLDFSFDLASLEDIEPYVRGRIGYIRAAETGAIPVEQGVEDIVRVPTVNGLVTAVLTVYPSVMSKFQAEHYLRAESEDDDIRQAQRQASNIVFPDGHWGRVDEKSFPLDEEEESYDLADLHGQQGFPRFVVKNGDNFFPSFDFRQSISTLAQIANYSCKYAMAIQEILTCPGNVFVYDEFVYGSGVIMFALCLEVMGFTRFNESHPVITEENGVRTVREGFPSYRSNGVRRYALLVGGISTNKINTMLNTMNSYENRHGDYIQVLISSRTGRDGINVKNVRQIHMLSAEWNPSATYQAISRGVRATSHRDLLAEQPLDTDGKPEPLYVNIYKHVALAKTLQGTSSVDLLMYRRSAEKDVAISRVLRFLQQCAVGCQTNYQRNVRPDDVDYSAQCAYQACAYACFDPPPTVIDYSTYDVLYAQHLFPGVNKQLEQLLRVHSSLTIPQMQSLWPTASPPRTKILIMALEKLIRENELLRDRFGFAVYLREYRGLFYLSRAYSPTTNPGYLLAQSTRDLDVIHSHTLQEVGKVLQEEEDPTSWNDLATLRTEDADFSATIDRMPFLRRVRLVEEAIVRHAKGDDAPVVAAVLGKYSFSIFAFHEPTAEIARAYEQLHTVRVKRGPKPKRNKDYRVRKINEDALNRTTIVEDEQERLVYLHTLYTINTKRTNYAATSRFTKADGQLRLYKPSLVTLEEGTWTNLNAEELAVYNVLLQKAIASRLEPYRQSGIYGILSEGIFRISDRGAESEKAQKNARLVRNGKICDTWYRNDLIDIMQRLGVAPPANDGEKLSRSELLLALRSSSGWKKKDEDSWSEERLRYHYAWASQVIYIPQMCGIIRERLQDTGKMVYA